MKPEKIIQMCESCFATHKATLIQNTDRYLIIDWRRADGSGEYYVNYIVDKKRGSFIVSGDLGDSIATWYNNLDPSNIKKWIKNDIEYYIGKIQCSSDLYYCESDEVVSDIKSYLSDCDIDDIIDSFNGHCSYYVDNEDEVWKYLEDEVSSCIYHSEFIPSEEIRNFVEDLYADYWEWLYDCGKRICTRVYLWADGFYKACNQLGI